MLVILSEACAGMPILVAFSFAMLLSAETKLPSYVKSFASSSKFLPTVGFLMLCLQFHKFRLG